ncbi:hypothetical protein GCM10018793_45010 [Streptomyces sulfonofaciens]|uniref:4'-phosphopantetheinyl transferase domain-containing protein n=1 Tax=Streptomyces sulfonofaciens TaxID=68272 RepID=A0A919GEX2_9ACTN|nr:hypothetical protein GCM10018793_45010 [Streptomyces sulfonofaciens]
MFRLPSSRSPLAAEAAAGAVYPPAPLPARSPGGPGPSADGGGAAPPLVLRVLNVVEEADAAAVLAPGVLDATEQKRAADFRREEHRRGYVAAHVALRFLLGARLGLAPGAVRLTRETCPTCGELHGRPAVVGGGVHFSLSHSGALALIAMAPVTVGADVEETPSREVADQTARMLHPDEAAELAALPDAERAMAFGRAWVRKEAYLKALGTGLSRSLALDYVGTGPTPPPGPRGWALTDVRVPQGYLAAVAVRV